jgi:hypothetical protein
MEELHAEFHSLEREWEQLKEATLRLLSTGNQVMLANIAHLNLLWTAWRIVYLHNDIVALEDNSLVPRMFDRFHVIKRPQTDTR